MARFLYSAFSDEAADSIDGQIAPPARQTA